jgi:hypothetical protein
MYQYNVEFVLEAMVIITHVSFDERPTDEFVIEQARQNIMSYYKIDPEVMYLQDVIVHEVEYA